MKLEQINRTLGKTFADHLGREVLRVGTLTVSAHALVNEVGCHNVVAAQGLTKTLRNLGITSIDKLKKLDPFSLYRVKGCGHTQVYVAMCFLEHRGVNPAEWWGWAVKGSSVQRQARASKAKRGSHEVPATAHDRAHRSPRT